MNERELRVILSAFDLARDMTKNDRWSWWVNTQYVSRLYLRLRDHGQRQSVAR